MHTLYFNDSLTHLGQLLCGFGHLFGQGLLLSLLLNLELLEDGGVDLFGRGHGGQALLELGAVALGQLVEPLSVLLLIKVAR